MKRSVWDVLGIRCVALERKVKLLEEDKKAKEIDDAERDRRLRALEARAERNNQY